MNNFSPEQVSEQLTRILSSEIFVSSKTLGNFLRFVVEETLQGREHALKEYSIGAKVLSKKADFNPQFDPAVRIHAGRLRRSLNEYYSADGKDDMVIISIPKGTYVPSFNPRIHSPLPARISADTKEPGAEKTTVAVLPFRNSSPTTEANVIPAFFEDGLSDQLSTELAKFPELSVISYYSCRSIAGKITDIREAGLLLDARYILTGSVQSNADQMRVRVQLVLAETREQIWANSYERRGTVTELFAIQDDIVKKVLSQVTGYYGAISRYATKIPAHTKIEDLKIYDAIFWYYHFVNETNEDIYHKAIAAMQHAVDIGPGYALGWAVLGELYIAGVFMGYHTEGIDNAIEAAIVCGRKAIKLDPYCQHAYQTLGLAYLFSQNKTEALKIIQEYNKQKLPISGVMGGMGFCLVCCGMYEQGIQMLDESIQSNPYYQWWWNGGISFYHFHQKDFEEAIYWAEKINMPHIAWEPLLKIASLVQLGSMEEAKKCWTNTKTSFPFLEHALHEYLNAFILDKELTACLEKSIVEASIA